tara:strand:+ start:88 stop:558 length:471 start_codon:yes stop_codon:yes gene_type:complete
MLTKIKANFDFVKLSNNVDKVIDETLEKVGSLTIDSMRKTIDKKGYGKYDPLTDVRVKQRKSGVYFPDKIRGSQYKTEDITPLKQMGNLYKSMEYKKSEGVHMLPYGLVHNDGLTDPRYKKKPMVKRQFIDIGIEKTSLESVQETLIQKINKYLEK